MSKIESIESICSKFTIDEKQEMHECAQKMLDILNSNKSKGAAFFMNVATLIMSSTIRKCAVPQTIGEFIDKLAMHLKEDLIN